MKIFYSELCVLGNDPIQNVDRLINAGAENIELMLDGGGWNDFHLHADELVKKLKAKNVGYAVHTPVWDANLTAENSHIRAAILETYKQTISFANKLGADHVVIHPGFCYTQSFNKETAKLRAKEAIDILLDFSKDYNLILLIENVGTTKSCLYTQEEFVAFCNALPPQAKCLIDIGHAHITKWNLESLINDLNDNLYALHLHDNNGISDSHLPIGEGTIDWNNYMSLFKKANKKINLILEYNMGIPVGKLTEGKRYLEEALK